MARDLSKYLRKITFIGALFLLSCGTRGPYEVIRKKATFEAPPKDTIWFNDEDRDPLWWTGEEGPKEWRYYVDLEGDNRSYRRVGKNLYDLVDLGDSVDITSKGWKIK